MSAPPTFTAVNPATGDALTPAYTDATPAEIDQAAEQAEAAFIAYRKTSATDRAAFLERIGEEIMALGDALIARCHAETGLPAGRLQGERGRTVNQLRLFAALLRDGSYVDARIDTAQPDRTPAPKPDLRHMQIPLGPVAVFGASNFPLAFSVAGGDTASALAAGCSVVVKAHPAHPGTSALVAAAIGAAAVASGMPEGVFSMVQGSSTSVGRHLVMHPLITAVGFTGSFRGGKALFDAAMQRAVPIPVFAEMGSINPVFMLPEAVAAHHEQLAEGLVRSVTLGVGQFCTNPGVVVAEASPATRRLVADAGGRLDGAVGGTMLTPGIREAYEAGVAEVAAAEGVTLVAAGAAGSAPCAGTPRLFETTAETFLARPGLSEEVFGPASIAVIAKRKADVLAIARGLEGHLTATLHGTPADLAAYSDLIDILERKVGRLIINGFPTGVEVCHAMVHGGPFPATTAPQTTSVGTAAIRRFTRPLCYQDFPADHLPEALRDGNPLGIWRLVDGRFTQDAL